MKNLLLVLCVVAFSTMAVGKPAFGIRGGLNLANAVHDPDRDYETKMKPGLLVGADIEVSLSSANTTMIRLEWLYAQKGWKEKGSLGFPGFSTVDYDKTSSVDEFVVAPFLVQRFPSEGIAPFLEFGPELGMNLSAEAEADIAGQTYTEDIPDWSDVNLSFNLGGGLALTSGKGEIIIDVRYNYGLLNMNTGQLDYDVKTNGVQFLLGYHFTRPEK